MARKQIKRLRVYVTRIGLYEWAVAAPNQKAALKAWDVRENLFANGAAQETQDVAAVEAALRAPGEPVKVPAPKVSLPPAANVVQLDGRRPKPAPASSPPRKDRSQLDAAEEALVAYRKEAKKRLAEIDRRRRTLEGEIEALEAEIDRQTRALEARALRERKFYEGG